MQPPFVIHVSNPAEVENSQKIETPVFGPGDVNCLVVYTGTALLNWVQPGPPVNDIGDFKLILDDNFTSKYGTPNGGFKVTAFFSIVSVFNAYDFDFEIANATPTIDLITGSFSITATLANDELDALSRLAYSVSVSVRKAGAPDMPPSGCVHLKDYQGGFSLTLLDNDKTNIMNPSSVECVIDPPAPNGANRLLIFTGDAIVDFFPSTDGILARGLLNIQFLRDLGNVSNLKASAASASLSSIFNNDSSNSTTFAIDCVQVTTGLHQELVGNEFITIPVPMLTAALAVQGGGGTAGIHRITYQAQVQIAVPFEILVRRATPGFLTEFQPAVTLKAGDQWEYELKLPTFGPARVTFDTTDHVRVQVPAPAAIPASTFYASSPQPTNFTGTGPSRTVLVTATLGRLTATATLILEGTG